MTIADTLVVLFLSALALWFLRHQEQKRKRARTLRRLDAIQHFAQTQPRNHPIQTPRPRYPGVPTKLRIR